jgi:hypothetical protein
LKSRAKKSLIGLMAAFFLIQVTIDLAHSVTAYPFEHYGMFSESFPAPDSLSTFEIIADGRRLEAADFGIYRWDMIQQPLAAFDRQSLPDQDLLSRHLFPAFPQPRKSADRCGGLSGLVPRLPQPPSSPAHSFPTG